MKSDTGATSTEPRGIKLDPGNYSYEETEKYNSPIQGSVNWENTGNIFWLGHDLMWTLDALFRGDSKANLIRGLENTRHHIRAMGLSETPMAEILGRLLDKTERTIESELTRERREELVRELIGILHRMGELAEEHQPGYQPSKNRSR